MKYPAGNQPNCAADERVVHPNVVDLDWKGPYGWPGIPRSDGIQLLNEVPEGRQAGIYLLTFELERGGFITLWPGITSRSFEQRLGEHRRSFLKGDYNVLDIQHLRLGLRRETWHGWAQARSPEGQKKFAETKDQIESDARKLISGIQLFVAKVENKRLSERIETEIVKALRKSDFRQILDDDHHEVQRSPSDAQRWVHNHSNSVLHGIPEKLEI